MLTKEKYIDAHTHTEGNADCVSVVSIFPDKVETIKKDKYYSLGLHPWFIPEKGVGKLLEKVEKAARMEEVVAIGECGLDKLASTSMEIQQFVFEKHIEIAEKVQKPLIIHCVRSFNELVQIKNFSNSSVEWVVHGFNNNLQIADMLIRHEMYLSIGKALLNPESNASKVITQLEDELYLLETDDSGHDISEIYKAVEDLLGMDTDILKLSMMTNFINCFKI